MAHLTLFGLDESHCRTRRQGRRKNKKKGWRYGGVGQAVKSIDGLYQQDPPSAGQAAMYVLCTPYEAANGLGDGPWWVACSKPRVHDGNCNRRLAENV